MSIILNKTISKAQNISNMTPIGHKCLHSIYHIHFCFYLSTNSYKRQHGL